MNCLLLLTTQTPTRLFCEKLRVRVFWQPAEKNRCCAKTGIRMRLVTFGNFLRESEGSSGNCLNMPFVSNIEPAGAVAAANSV